ncbi:MAG: SIMPL domain-containing protein [Alphaproteobacteria bacterium]|nr:SIMPL domain-containing protein [Alphaproteobacteria bacterium]
MNKYITAAFGILILLVFGFAAGRWFVPVESKRTITTAGECLARVDKDRTAITLRVSVIDADAARSLTIARAEYESLAASIKKIDDKTMELQTARFDSFEKQEWNHLEQRMESRGFETNIELQISSRNADTIENILENPRRSMANTGDADVNIYPENLRMFASSEKMKPVIEACIQTAVENARERAESVASADGMRIGRMVSASFTRTTSGGDNMPMPIMRMSRAVAMDIGGGGGAPTLFSTGDEISVSISAEFEVR